MDSGGVVVVAVLVATGTMVTSTVSWMVVANDGGRQDLTLQTKTSIPARFRGWRKGPATCR